MTDLFLRHHMNAQDVRAAGSGFMYKDPQTGELMEAPGKRPMNWEEGYPEGIEPGTVESQNYDAKRAKFSALPNYALSRDYLDDEVSKKEGSQYDDPIWIGASRILYDYINKQPGRKKHGRNREIKPQPAKPLDSGYSYADWGVNFMLKFNYNLPYMVYQADKVRNMPADVAKAMYYLMETSDRDGISAYNTGMGIAHAAWDATNYIGLATFGIGVAGSQAGKQATKAGIREILKEITLANVTKASMATGVEGAVFAAADDIARQTVQIAGDENKTGYDKGSIAQSAGIGFVAGEELTRMGAPAVNIAGEAIKKGVTTLRNKAQDSQDNKAIQGVLDAEEEVAKTIADESPEMDLDKSVGSGALKENVPMNEIDELGFYSELLSVARMLPPKIATADAMAILKKKAGVKPDELKWVGIDEFLATKDNQKSFDREELVEFIRGNQVKLEVNTRGGRDINDDNFDYDDEGGYASTTTTLTYEDVADATDGIDPEFFYSRKTDMLSEFDIDEQAFIGFIRRSLKDESTASTQGRPIDSALDNAKTDAAIEEKTNAIYRKFLSMHNDDSMPYEEIAYGSSWNGQSITGEAKEVQDYFEAFIEAEAENEFADNPWKIIGNITQGRSLETEGFNRRPEGYYAIGNDEIGYVVMLNGKRDDVETRNMTSMLGDRGIYDEIQVQQYIEQQNIETGYTDAANAEDYADEIHNKGRTLFGEYTLDGLGDQNYKEVTLTFANPDQITSKQSDYKQGIYTNSHFSDGEVVHYRYTSRQLYYPDSAQKGEANINTFYDEQGNYTGPVNMRDSLMVYAADEIQSDWAQKAQYGKGLATEENLTKWATSNDEAVKGIRTALSGGIVDNMMNDYQLGDDVRRELTEGLDFMFDQAEADTGPKAYFIKSIPAALSEIYGLQPTLNSRKLSLELVQNFGRVMDTVLVDQDVRFNPDGNRSKLDLLLAQDTSAVGIDTFQSIFDGFIASRPGMPNRSADEYAALPDTAKIASLLRFEGKQLDSTDKTPFSRNKAEEAILYWRENGKLPEGFELGVDENSTNLQNIDFGSGPGPFAELMNKVQEQGSTPELVNEIFQDAVTLDEKEFMGKMVKLHENIAAQDEGFEPPSWSVDSPSDKYSIAKQMAEVFMLDLYSRLRMQLKNSAPAETYAIANTKPTMPDSPFVKGGKDFSALALKRMMTDAVRTGHDAISIPSHELLTSIPGIGLQSDKLYNTIIPKEIEKLIEGTDAKIERVPAARMFLNDTDDVGNMRGEGSSVPDWDERANPEGMYFNLIRITPQLRDRIKKGFALFSAMPMALMGTQYMGEEGGTDVNTTY